ncbi:hypothetical protein BAE44_0023900 [Dichanthelium oligosanthes]|uniref:Uncharacterized protein n=1 Tax=Dichanthelium oligosanthes TaxID=888268 RepID=A0A1E5UQD4_9POAL|nr:hypothetical protein BAE44_0023900 [Dichanthelium oligosanthes]
MADPAAMHKVEVTEEDVAVTVEFAPYTTTVGRINSLVVWGFLPHQEEPHWHLPPLRGGRVPICFRAKMTDSNKGWHSEWFYVANPLLPLPMFSGRFAQKVDEWEWVTGEDEKKAWVRPMLALLRPLKDAGLTGVWVLWTFFERRVQPLAARAHPFFQYTSAGDSTRTSQEPLTLAEMRSRVWTVIKRGKEEDDIAEIERLEAGLAPEPAARHEGNDPFVPLCARPYYLPLLEDRDRRATNRAENERLRARSLEKKKWKAEKARRHMQRAQRGSLSEELEKEEVIDDDDEEGGDNDDDDDDDDNDDLGERYAEALGLGKRSAEGAVGEPSSKRLHADPSQGLLGAAPSSGDILGQSGDVPSSTEGAPRNVEPAPTVEVEPLAPTMEVEPNPAVESLQTAVAQPTVPPLPAVTLAMPPPARTSTGSSVGVNPWLQFLPCSSSPLLRAAPIVAVGTSSSATTAATGSVAAAEGGAMAGHEEVPGVGAVPRSMTEPQAKEIPPGGAAAGETEVLDLMGDASEEEEDLAALLEVAIDEEVVEKMDPKRSEALPDEAGQETGA